MDLDSLRFTSEHEWVRLEDNDIVVVGITEFAAGELGDIVYIELPEVGTEISANDSMGTIEAVKTVADLYAPVTGVVEEINSALEESPESVNDSPYDDGWFVKIKVSDPTELESLMTHNAYQEMIGQG